MTEYQKQIPQQAINMFSKIMNSKTNWELLKNLVNQKENIPKEDENNGKVRAGYKRLKEKFLEIAKDALENCFDDYDDEYTNFCYFKNRILDVKEAKIKYYAFVYDYI